MKKQLFILIAFVVNTIFIYSQANLIQSIDFDSEQRVVYGLTGFYDSSYAVRYKDENFEIWNLTEIFNLPFYWIATGVDKQDNIWAFLQNTLYKCDNGSWIAYGVPNIPSGYIKYSDLAINSENVWLSIYAGAYGVYKFRLSDNTWTLYSSGSGYPDDVLSGTIFLKGDSTFVGNNKGLFLIYNDSAIAVLDTVNSTLETQAIYCFYIDSQGSKWLGTFDYGLVKWIDNSTFVVYNTGNSDLPDDFVNAIAEDSQGTLWLATDGGIACLKNDTIISYSHLVSEPIATLAVDYLDRVWLGGIGTGSLYVFDGIDLTVITDVDDKQLNFLPQQYALHQNYPNPFNPSTKISWQSPIGSHQTLKVYDLLGREVAILVDEFKISGSYEVEFNAAALSSGIYFYKIQAGEFISVRKMVLQK